MDAADPTATAHRTLDTPLGRYRIDAVAAGITAVALRDTAGIPAVALLEARPPAPPRCGGAAQRHLDAAARALDAYFAGRRREFRPLVLAPRGTPFQRRVWEALCAIPFGETRSYAALAHSLQRPGAARAVGGANAGNPLAILVPCHRVIASDGGLCGYAGGAWRKRWLLEHEGATPHPA